MSGRERVRLLAYCGATEWGGAEAVLGHLFASLGPHVETSLLGVEPSVLDRVAAHRPGTPVTVVPRIGGKQDVASILAHRRAMVAARPDVVQLNLPAPFAEPWSVLAALTLTRTPVVAVEHLPMPTRSRGLSRLKRWEAPRLAAHLAVGTAAAREVERLSGRPPGTVEVVANGVPEPPPGPSAPRPPGADLVVGGVGRLRRQKGFDVLVRAVARVPGVHLVLVGDGPERAALEGLAGDLAMTERLTMTGWVEPVTGWLRCFDVLAMPSRFEGLPLVLLEAMLVQRVVVATDVGSTTDALCDGVTGLVVPVEDDEALAAALVRLRDDGNLRRRLGEAGGALARERFTAAAMARSYEEVYARVLRRT